MLFLKIIYNQQTVKALTFVGVFCLFTPAFSQKLSGKILADSKAQFIYLNEVIGFNSYKVDSCEILNGSFEFNLAGKPKGYYQLSLSDINRIQIIHTNEDIEINFNDTILQNRVEAIQSIENTTLWQYKYYSRDALKGEKKLIIQQSYLEKGNQAWQKLQRERDSLSVAKRNYLNALCKENPELLFAKLVGATIRPYYISEQEKKEHFFDNIDFSDPVMVRSSILSSAMMEYFQLHTEYNEIGFQTSVDKILDLSSINDENYEFCLNFILNLFNEVGPDVVFQYVVETYLLDG